MAAGRAHRRNSDLDLGGGSFDDLLEGLGRAGIGVADLTAGEGWAAPMEPGTVVLRAPGRTARLALPVARDGRTAVDAMDHAVIERELFGRVLSLNAEDKRITYVGGGYPISWLVEEVESGRAAMTVLMVPVRIDDFIAVTNDRQRLPRKSTWFMPKARAGLVLAAVDEDGRG